MAQFIQFTDNFTDADGASGITNWGLYREVEPWDNTSFDSATGFTCDVNSGASYLTDLVQSHLGLSAGAATMQAEPTGSGVGVGWVAVSEDPDDEQSVRIRPRFLTLVGEFDEDYPICVGVSARMSLGTVTERTASRPETEYTVDCDGYFFCYVNDTTSQPAPKYVLVKVVAGVCTLLGSADVPTLDGAFATFTENTAPRAMRIEVTGTPGGASTIRCYAEHWLTGTSYTTTGGGGGTESTEDELISVAEGTSLAAGRAGFGMQVWSNHSASVSAGFVVDSVEVRDASDDSLKFRDEFRRVNRYGSKMDLHDVTGLTPQAGYVCSLACKYTGMYHGRSADSSIFNHTGHDERTGSSRIGLGKTIAYPATQEHGYYMRQWGTPDPSASSTRLTAQFQNDATNDREAGVFARAAFQAQVTGDGTNFYYRGGSGRLKTGYLAKIVYTNGGSPVWELQVYHFDGSTSGSYTGDILGTADLSAYSLAFASDWDLEFEVVNFAVGSGGTSSGTAVAMQVNVGLTGAATLVTIVPTTGLAGVEFDDGWLIDSRSAATLAGTTEGVYFYPDAAYSDVLMRVNALTNLALSDPPVFDEGDAASVVMSSEVTGKTGTLDTPLDWPVRTTFRERASTLDIEHPHAAAVLFQHRARRVFECVYGSATQSEVDALRTFVTDHDGGRVPFDWAVPESTETIAARFASPLTVKLVGHTGGGDLVYSYSFELEELFDGS